MKNNENNFTIRELTLQLQNKFEALCPLEITSIFL